MENKTTPCKKSPWGMLSPLNLVLILRILVTTLGLLQAFIICAAEPDENDKVPYRTAFSANESLCKTMLTSYNADVPKRGIEKFSGKEFEAIHWKPVILRDPPTDIHAEVALVDLYNDGSKETILRYKDTGFNGPVSTMAYNAYLVPKLSGDRNVSSFTSMSYKEISDKGYSMRPRWYRFHYNNEIVILDYPEITEPFAFQGATYVSFRELPRTSLRHGKLSISNFHLIVKYTKPDTEKYNQMLRKERRTSADQKNALQDDFFTTMCVFAR